MGPKLHTQIFCKGPPAFLSMVASTTQVMYRYEFSPTPFVAQPFVQPFVHQLQSNPVFTVRTHSKQQRPFRLHQLLRAHIQPGHFLAENAVCKQSSLRTGRRQLGQLVQHLHHSRGKRRGNEADQAYL